MSRRHLPSNMKAFGLQKLVRLYIEWNERNAETAEPETEAEAQ